MTSSITISVLLLLLSLSLYQSTPESYSTNRGSYIKDRPNHLKLEDQSSNLTRLEHSNLYVPKSKCRISGVYNQLCLRQHRNSREENNSKYRHYFNCFSKAICGYQQGKCQWFKTKQFNKCIIKAKSLSAHSEIRTVSNLLAHPSYFDTNPVVALSDPLNENRSVGRTITGTIHRIPRELLLNLN